MWITKCAISLCSQPCIQTRRQYMIFTSSTNILYRKFRKFWGAQNYSLCSDSTLVSWVIAKWGCAISSRLPYKAPPYVVSSENGLVHQNQLQDIHRQGYCRCHFPQMRLFVGQVGDLIWVIIHIPSSHTSRIHYNSRLDFVSSRSLTIIDGMKSPVCRVQEEFIKFSSLLTLLSALPEMLSVIETTF